jgi:hypothetical protein
MRALGITILALFITAALATGEEPKPDFSGTWIFNLEKSKLESSPPTKSVFVIEHQEPNFKLTRTHTRGERSNTLSFEVTTDGKEVYEKKGNWETWTRLYWLGEELVLDMKMAFRGEEGTNIVHYQLIDGGATFVAAEWYHMRGQNHHNLWVFDRAAEE